MVLVMLGKIPYFSKVAVPRLVICLSHRYVWPDLPTDKICSELKLNGDVAHSGSMPWVLEEVEEKINSVYKGLPLESLEIEGLNCKSTVAN